MSSSSDLRQAMKDHQASEPHGSAVGPYIHDIVYGANDGIVTTFAVVSGVAGADLAASVVIILGFANVLADGLSMGLGNFLSMRSKEDNYQRVLKEELLEIETIPDIEREEIREIFEKKGFSGEDLERVVRVITSQKNVWLDTMMREEHGLAPEDFGKPGLHGFVTFVSFILFGSIPILPYAFSVPEALRFKVTCVAAGIALLMVGLLRSYVTRERMIRGPIEIFLVGALCAAASYIVGMLLRGMVPGGI